MTVPVTPQKDTVNKHSKRFKFLLFLGIRTFLALMLDYSIQAMFESKLLYNFLAQKTILEQKHTLALS